MRRTPSTLDIKLYGKTVGKLSLLPNERSIFSFTDAYIMDANRPPLSLGFKDESGGLITDFNPTQTRLLPFFSNLLPEGHLRDYLARKAGVKTEREYHLLAALGRDLPGAITVAPENHAPENHAPIADATMPPDEDAQALDKDQSLRFSLAGEQLKFSAIASQDQAKGLTIPAGGCGGSWIVKLPSPQFSGIPENEYSMLSLAQKIGIDVPPIDLIDVQDIENLPTDIGAPTGKALAIKRFDRGPNGPTHIEDFAQIFNIYPERKYDGSALHIAKVLINETGLEGVTEFIRRLTFCVLTGNGDMHMKNWSLLYPDGRTPRLSPAYDLVSTIPYIKDESAALKFIDSRRFEHFTLDEVAKLADKARVPRKPLVDAVIETHERFMEAWQEEKAHLPLSAGITQKISDHLLILESF